MTTLKKSVAALLTGLLLAAGLTAVASPAAAAPGDVTGATLDWGIKSSFTSYIQGPIAHGGWTVSGSVSQTAPFSWSGGAGAADQAGATGSVGYGSSIHFVGHDGLLDVTFSDFRVVQSSATSATVLLDAVYSSLSAPGTFTTVDDITFATVDLASASNTSDATTVAYSGAPAVLTADGAAAFAGFYTEGTALDALSFSWPVEQLPVPAVSVSKTDSLHPGGESITISGTGFLPNAPATNATRPPLAAGAFGGVYVVFGKFADTWQPSEGAASSARKVGSQSWLLGAGDAAGVAGTIPLNADGSFSITIDVSRSLDAFAGNYGIYTYAGGGAVYAPFETATALSFSSTPIVSVSQTSDLDPNGDTVTVQGWNFLPNAPATNGTRPPLSGKFGGAYVIFGKFADTWQPSAGAPSSARKVGDQKWVVDAADAPGLGAQAVAVNADGSFSLTLSVAQNLDAFAGNYGIYTYPGSGAAYAPFETATPIAFTPATQTTTTLTAAPATGLVAGQSTTLTASVSPLADGTLEILSGSTVLLSQPADADGISTLVTGLTEGSHGYTARFTPADPLSFAASESAPLTLEVGPAPIVPTVTVSKTTGLHPGGEVITVTGTGFLPSPPATNGTRPPLAGTFSGAYVIFGKFADTWKPSESAPSSARKVGDQKWVVDPANVAGLGSQAVALGPDGSFSLTLNAGRTDVLDAAAGNYGIYTYAGSGAVYAPFETFTPIAFDTAPVVSVSQVEDLNPAGDTVTVRGWNFTPSPPATTATRPPLAGKFGGAYVVFGKFQDGWQPSAGGASGLRGIGDQQWLVSAPDAASVPGTVALSADGSFTVELDVHSLPQYASGDYGVFTYAGGGTVYTPFETATPIAFTAAEPTTVTLTGTPASGLTAGDSLTLTATVDPDTVPGDVRFAEGGTVLGTVPVASGAATITIASVTAGSHTITATFLPGDADQFAWSTATLNYDVAPLSVAAGSLIWGIKESFRSYVTGPIAQGGISTIGAGTSGGAFVFGQAPGASFDSATNTGSSPYSGSVRFTGHGGILDVSIANPVIRVDSASSATLLVSANGTQLAFASLDLASGTRTSSGNTVGWSGVPATLTAAGSGVFSFNGSAFYPAGTALDPVTFVIGSPSSGGGTATVAAFEGQRQPAATPPATTGITVDPDSLKNLKAGSQITITADGFEANEEDIIVVIYSDPILLDRIAADANGAVTWTGRLPAALTGEHTLTLQGSVDRGVVLNIPARVTTAAEGCPVDDATLTWGFKETFRSYISGSIANGEWTVADGATYETPNFGWSDGTGAYDPEGEGLIAFTGSIRFTGHAGILDTTVANPQLRFLDDGTAVLLLDVKGVTQDGAPIDQKAVEFADLDLSDAVSIDGDTVTITAAPATLTPAGATAFGTYPADEPLDPITATFTLPADCVDPVVAETGAAGEPTASTGPDLTWLLWLIIGLAVLAVALVVTLVLVRRRPTP